jgi:alpha-2-macroglobulin
MTRLMNRYRLVVGLTLLALASLACNFLVPVPATPVGTAGVALSAAPALTQGTGTPVAAAITPASATTAPNVVGYIPDRGETLLPGGAIEVYFDQAMEPASTEAAFAITPSLLGRFSWPDGQTLRFTPTAGSGNSQPYQPSQSYTVTVSAVARNARGVALRQPAAFDVQTAAPLAVARVFPAPGSSNLPPGQPITVMFDRAVVADDVVASAGDVVAGADNVVAGDNTVVSATASAAGPQPLELSPAVSGEGRWINASTYQFQPFTEARTETLTDTLAAGTRYTARIGRALADLSGVALAADYTWQFSTTVPLLTQRLPAPDAVNVPVTATLVLGFSQPMDTASVADALQFQTSSGAAVPGRLTWNEARTEATFSPAAPWPAATVIKARLAGSAAAAGGLKLSADTTWNFSTLAPFITDSQPVAEAVEVPLTTTVVLTFNQPMDRTSTELAFSLTVKNDRIGGRLAWNDDSTRLVFTPETRLPYGTHLVAALGRTARAADGQVPLVDQTRAFTTVAAPAVESIWPASGQQDVSYIDGGVSVRFASPMDAQSLVRHIAIVPRPANVSIASEGRAVTVKWDFAPDTKYTVTLEPELADIYGTPLGKSTEITFHTVPLYQTVTLYPEGRFRVSSARLPAKVYVLYCGLPAIETSLYRLKPQDLKDLNPANMTLLRRWKQTLPAGGDGLLEVFLDPAQKALLPGLYYVQVAASPAGAIPLSVGQVLVVVDSNLTLKVAGDEALVWATTYNTGQPIAGRSIQIFDEALNLVGSGVTDAKGLFRQPLPKANSALSVYYALADDRTFGGYALTASDWGLRPTQTTVGDRVYLYTDRAVYHAGQTVFVKGVVRQEDDARYQVPLAVSAKSVSLWNQDRQSALGAASAELNAFGTLSVTFSLPPEAAAGNYSVRVNGAGYAGEARFRVEDPPKPEFQVTLTADQADATISDTVRLALQAQTFAGAALPGAVVEWQVSGVADLSGRSVTDVLGRFELPVTPKLIGRLDFVARVTDLAGRRVGAQTSLVVHPALVQVSVTPDRHLATAGQASAIQVLTRDWTGKPVPGQAVELVFRREAWQAGQLQWVEVGRTPLLTDAAGQASAPFFPPGGGLYQVQAATLDERGRVTTADTNVWALPAQGAVARVEATAPLTVGVRLMADQQLYRPGDLAEILIASPYTEPVRALITVERNRILLADVITITGSSAVYSLPMLDAYAPNVFVNVVLVRGARADDRRALFSSAQLNLPVTIEQQVLRVQLTVDKPQALPGDTVTFALTATDALSHPVSAEFSLALVDAAAWASETPMPADFFYAPHALGVNTALGLKFSSDGLAPPDFRLACRPGLGDVEDTPAGTEGAAKAGANAGDTVLNAAPRAVVADSMDTAFWQARVTTGPDGHAQVTVVLPARLNTWRLDARGVTKDTLVGQAVAEVVVKRPLVLSPIAPHFFVAGDQVTLAAVVANNTASAIAAQVALTSTGLTLSGPAIQQVSVPALGQVRVEWPVTAEAALAEASAADLSFSVKGGGYAEVSQPVPSLPVYRYRAVDVPTLFGELDQPGSHAETMAVPHRYETTAGYLEVTVTPAVTASTGSADFTVTVNDQPMMPTAILTGMAWFRAPILPGLNALVIGRGAGPEKLLYAARLALYPEIAGLPALNRGLSLTRQYFKPSADCGEQGQPACPVVSEARAGDTLLAKLTLIVPRAVSHLRVEDSLPAGAEIVSLPANPEAAPSTVTYLPEAEAGRFSATVGPEKLTLEAANVPAGTYEFIYQLSAGVAGRYSVIPPLARASDEVYGQGAGSAFTVLP